MLDVESEYHAPLLKSIYGLLMCLPQGDAFRLLNDRLTTVCNLRDNLGVSPVMDAGSTNAPAQMSTVKTMQMDKLLKRFDEVVVFHRKAKERSHKLAVEEEQSKHQPGSSSHDSNNSKGNNNNNNNGPIIVEGTHGQNPKVATSSNTQQPSRRQDVTSPIATTKGAKTPQSFDKRAYADSRA